MAVRDRAAKVRRAARANPATTTGSVGAVIALIGVYLGWSSETIATVSSIALVLVPVVRGLVAWWERRQAPSADEV